MKSFVNLSLVLLLGNGVIAHPAAVPTETDDLVSTLDPVAELASGLDSVVDEPYLPLGTRDDSRMAAIKARAAKAFGRDIDMDKPIPLDAYKKSNAAAAGLPEGHPITRELLEILGRTDIQVEASKMKRGTFNAAAQLVDVTGDNAFVAPDFDAGDKRGPCPGMNSLANHGFVARNGVASMAETIVAANNVFGMGIDITTFLAIYSTVFSGSIVSLNPSYSIGDYSATVENALDNLGGLLGKPMGLDATHNTFEVDGSSTRGDLYDPVGNNHDLNMTYFMELYDLQKDAEVPNYSVDVIIENSLQRFNECVAFNPYFYYGPFSGFVLRSGASMFIARLMGNASEEYPDGFLDKETLKSFFAVSGPEDALVYTRGHERIPDNWYRRAGDYGLPGLGLDLVNMAIKEPKILGIGGNTNGVNTYAGINPSDIIGGALGTSGLLEGNNLICFAFQSLKLGSPNSLSTLYSTLAAPLEMILDAISTVVAPLDCPSFGDLQYGGTDLWSYLNATYPGAAMSGSAL